MHPEKIGRPLNQSFYHRLNRLHYYYVHGLKEIGAQNSSNNN